tara:strand:+ start:302 stop:496 length:195 start_codon:yes stop_codon:yes gene_type:complete
MIDIKLEFPSIPSIKLNELIIKTPMNDVNITPAKLSSELIPRKPYKLLIIRLGLKYNKIKTEIN